MRWTIRWSAILGVATIVFGLAYVASPAHAADGILDTAFDDDGIVTTNLGGTDDKAFSVAIQTDGKIVVAGYSETSTRKDFALARYNTNGSPDTTFNGNGIVITNLGGTDDKAFSVAIQTDGKIVVAGYSNANTGTDFALARYNTNGSPDTTFDGDGIVFTNLGGTDEIAFSVAIQTDGKIVVAGYSNANTGYDFALARYNTNGSPDTTFDVDGIVFTDLGATDLGNSVAIQTDGKIVVAGYSNNSVGADFALARYNTNGSPDTTFDVDGIVITDLGGTDETVLSVAIQTDGKIVVAGYSNANTGYDFALARYNTNGSPDTTFDVDGIVFTNLGGSDDEAFTAAIQADGKIVVAGYSNANTGYDFALARYNTNGSPDTTFDVDGIVFTNLGGTDDTGRSVAIQTDGKIVVAGYRDTNSGYDFALARYEATPLAVTLAASTTTSSSASITFTVTGTGTIDCTSLSTTAGVDFNLTGISAITSITQTSSTVCTIAATSSAIADGVAITSTLTATSSFSVGFTNGNSRTTMSGSPQSVIVTVPATMAPTTTVVTASTVSSITKVKKAESLPETGDNSSMVVMIAIIFTMTGLVLTSRRRINR